MTLPLTEKICAVLPPGTYTDTSVKGLRFIIKEKQKYFLYRRAIAKKSYNVYLGLISLSQARTKASCFNGMSPTVFLDTVIKPKQAARRRLSPSKPLFKHVIKEFLEFKIKCRAWTSDRTIMNGYSRIKRHVLPHLGNKRLEAITYVDVAKIAEGDWGNAKTVGVVIGLVRECFNWAIAKGYVSDDKNPADMSGPLKYLLPTGRKTLSNHKHGSLPLSRIPEFFQTLRQLQTMCARCFEFSILTATRSNTVRHAKWEDVDLKEGVWSIPAQDLKIKENGRLLVPLCPKVIEYLKSLGPKESGYLFPSPVGGLFSDNAFFILIRRLNCVVKYPFFDEEQSSKEGHPVRATQHGIARAGFKTWAKNDLLGNDVKYDDKVSELCLHHKVKDIYNGAYERNSFWARRRQMMTEWADFIMKEVQPTPLKPGEQYGRLFKNSTEPT